MCISNSVSAFDSRNNAFRSGKIAERRYRFIVSCRYILRTPAIIKSCVFRPYAGVIEPCRNAVYRCNLAVFILQK